MRIFNVGLPEFVFIILLVFIVIGPEKAVKEAGNLGRWIRRVIKSPFWKDLVSTSQDIKDIPRKILDDAEIQKTLDEIDRSTNNIIMPQEEKKSKGKSRNPQTVNEENKIRPD